LAVSGATGFVTFVVPPLTAHSRMTGVSSTDVAAADARRVSDPVAESAPAAANACSRSLLCIFLSLSELMLERRS
jgi:hypothetical protein